MKNISLLIFSLICISASVFAQQGKIAGQIVDAKSGEELIGATVQVEGSSAGTVTDISGSYQLSVDPGTYTLLISYISYASQKVEEIAVSAGETVNLDFSLQEESTELQEVVVSAEAIRDNDVTLLKIQKNALAVQDGISAREMSQLGIGNAAESMRQVTGASIEDGKYVVMRGLGDRYSISQLNGVTLPSADPYRNSSSLDLIPSDMVDNIVTVKTYTPDQPGNFTGGKVDITTKSLPDEFYMNLGISGTYNTQSSLINNFLTDGANGKLDGLGYDDGTRSRPAVLDQYGDRIRFGTARATANAGQIPANAQQRTIIDETAKALDNPFVASPENVPIDHSIDFSVGNSVQLLGKNFGYNLGLNYKKGYTYFNDGTNGFYTQANANEMVTEQNFTTEKGVKNATLGGILSLAYQLSPGHQITLSNLYNHINTVTARIAGGFWRNTGQPFYQDRYIDFEERELNNTQLRGEHFFESLRGIKLNWTLGYATSTQDNPDLRLWGYTNSGANNSGTYLLQQSEVGFLPSHFYRYLKDKQYNAQVDISVPFTQDKENEIKLGVNYSDLDRNFDELLYSYVQVARTQFNPDYITFSQAAGDFGQFFSLDNTGFINTPESNGTGRGYGYGNYYSDQTNADNSYTGNSTVKAAYLMAAYKLFPKLKAIGGARVEVTDLGAQSKGSDLGGNIEATDVLPALNLIYQVSENSNLRAAVSQTLARPNIREIAPFAALGGIAFPLYLGNSNLKRTLIQNYDLRYEVYPNPGEVFAVSAYYKGFNNPIVWQLTPGASTPEVRPVNVDQAIVYGAEVEFRKSLGFITPALENMRVSTNVSYIYSRVNKSAEEMAALRNADRPNIEETRPFQGQSPYIINFSLFHMSDKLAWENTVSFNVFGDRLSFVTGALDPDVYEQSRPSLNFISKKKIGDKVNIGFNATNLLNMEYRQEYADFGNIFESYRVGRSYAVSFTYSF